VVILFDNVVSQEEDVFNVVEMGMGDEDMGYL
jgi:hypothetical protein